MNIYDFTKQQLAEYFISHNFKKYHATQVYEWLYVHKVNNFEHMINLSQPLIIFLKTHFNFGKLIITEALSAKDTDKLLIDCGDNNYVEVVLMTQKYGYSLCLSTQIGCNMRCRFCASGALHKVRNLTAGEMVGCILLTESYKKVRVSSLVLMGIGEPFDNFDNVFKMIDIVNDAKGLAIGARHITISTCGIAPKIIEMATKPYQVNLAISLHAPNDELRSKLMPINRKYNLKELMVTCREYTKLTNRRITFEYILIKDVNDSIDHARQLSKLISDINCYINLIPYNDSNGLYQKSNNALIFYDILKKSGKSVTIRREFGTAINAACGQLRARKEG